MHRDEVQSSFLALPWEEQQEVMGEQEARSIILAGG